MPFSLKSYKTAEEAKSAILKEIPQGTSRRRVEEFITSAGLKCFDKEADILSCKFVESSTSMVHVTWSFGFYFNEKREFDRVNLSRGLTGP